MAVTYSGTLCSFPCHKVATEWSVDWDHIRLGGKLGGDHNNEVRRGYIARTRLPPASKHHRFKGNLLPVLIKMVPTGMSAVSNCFVRFD